MHIQFKQKPHCYHCLTKIVNHAHFVNLWSNWVLNCWLAHASCKILIFDLAWTFEQQYINISSPFLLLFSTFICKMWQLFFVVHYLSLPSCTVTGQLGDSGECRILTTVKKFSTLSDTCQNRYSAALRHAAQPSLRKKTLPGVKARLSCSLLCVVVVPCW